MTPPVKHLLEYSPVEGFLPLAQQHPFVTGGVVASWRIRAWREVLAP
jgi:hypothetical protein